MPLPRPSWHHLLTWRRVLLVAAASALVGVLLGCWGAARPTLPVKPPAPDPAPAETPPRSAAVETPAPPGETSGAALVRTLRDQLANLEGEAAAVRNKLGHAERTKAAAEAEARLAPVRAAVAWVTWLGFLAGAAGVVLRVALFFWKLPIGGGTAWALIIGGPLVAMCAQGFGLALPWLAIGGLVLLVLGAVVFAFLALRKWAQGHRVESFWYQATAAALGARDPEERARIDRMALNDQRARGVLAINDRALFGLPVTDQKIPMPPTHPPGSAPAEVA
jgi:hypothetical protein